MYSINQSESETTDLNCQRKKGLFCDGVLEAAGGQMFPIHKSVLITAAPHIASLFNWSPAVKLPEVEADVLETILDYIYTDQITIDCTDHNSFSLMLAKFNKTAQLLGLKGNRINTEKSKADCLSSFGANVFVITENSQNDIIPKSSLENHENLACENLQDQSLVLSPVPVQCESFLPELFPQSQTIKTKRVTCNECQKTFVSESALETHMVNHTGEKPYTCKYCKRSFAFRNNWIVHLRVHTGEKPYKCTLCEKTFTQQTSLKIHSRVHSGEKPYKCELCGKTFASPNHFKNHLKKHTIEKSNKREQCDKTFADASYFKVHLKRHTVEKSNKCEQCDKTFADASYLKIHMRKHTGETPYKCPHCDRSFARNDHMKRHCKTHFKNKEAVNIQPLEKDQTVQ